MAKLGGMVRAAKRTMRLLAEYKAKHGLDSMDAAIMQLLEQEAAGYPKNLPTPDAPLDKDEVAHRVGMMAGATAALTDKRAMVVVIEPGADGYTLTEFAGMRGETEDEVKEETGAFLGAFVRLVAHQNGAMVVNADAVAQLLAKAGEGEAKQDDPPGVFRGVAWDAPPAWNPREDAVEN